MDLELGKETYKDILVIDDDDVMREKLHRILHTSPYKLQDAASGEEATALLEKNEFDCVLLDNRLGDIDGINLIPAIRNLSKRPCPIIMITGQGNERLIIEAMRSGVYDYVNKNQINLELLSAIITAGLRWAELEKELRNSQEKLEYLSMYDGLTNLPNRHLFFDRLDQARLFSIRENCGFALLMMDLNMFKEVNDTFGHAVGDELLKQTGLRMKEVSRTTDTFARLGGDEFAAILTDVKSRENAITVVNKIIEAINAPFIIDNQIFSIGISVGVAFFSANDIDSQALLARADSAMYKAKNKSRGYEIYEDVMVGKKQSTTIAIAGHIGNAIKHREFTLKYQPQISLADGEVCGVEALARWESPILGSISPLEFICVAERTSVIVELSYLIFDMALEQANKWQQQGIVIPISVNLSAKLLDVDDVVLVISNLLNKHHIKPELLTIEITETALLTNPAYASTVITQLSEIGVKITIDDFGTGYTSFKYLRQFKFNELKIDQLFVSVLEKNTLDASIIKSFVSLGEGFNVTLIAEGVEDIDRLLLLKELGCARAQGYFISKPFDGNNLANWLTEWKEKIPRIFDSLSKNNH
jgi:diguanylate cyclase (GGDEF)-like protein